MEYMRINAEAEGSCLCHHASACPKTKDTAVSFWKMQKSPTCPEEVLWKLACCILMVGIACRCGFGCLQITKNALGQVLNDPRNFHLLLVRVDSIILPPASPFNVFKQFQCISGFGVNLVEVIQDPWLRPTRPQKRLQILRNICIYRNIMRHPTACPTLNPNPKYTDSYSTVCVC